MKNDRGKIIIIDDDEICTLSLRRFLILSGFKVEYVLYGAQALGKIRETNPDLIILDLLMPEINGYELYSMFKKDPYIKDIPIVVLSAMSTFNNHTKEELHVEGHITKPYDMKDLLTKLDTILKERRNQK